MKGFCPYDPFKKDRIESGVATPDLDGDRIPVILRFQDVRDAAKNVATFSSDTPFRVPIPSEEKVRSVRQLPIETDPPEHTEYRKIVEPFFRRPTQPEMVEKVRGLIAMMLDDAASRDSIEVVRDFALPLQSRALTYLLNVPETEAEVWIGWGVHVFHDGADEENKGQNLEAYLQSQFDQAVSSPGDDFFSALTRATYRGRPLTRDEMVGFANLAFAGGRDTIITTVSSIVAYFADHPEALALLRDNPKMVITAGEEFVRVVSPLTHIGRTCPEKHSVGGIEVEAGQRVSLCWASANFDETVFDAPEDVRLDRKPNPHVGFGFGPHNCLGAPHARLIIRSLLQQLSERIKSISILKVERGLFENVESLREVGYKSLTVKFE